MKKVLRILTIGTITTLCRLGFQLLMPNSSQIILKDSIFVINGTLPFVFSILSLFTYSLISTFALIMYSNTFWLKKHQGIKFALSLCFLWSTYLFEPLPHATSILTDSLAYVLVDSLALMIMGILLDFLFFENREKNLKLNNIKMKATDVSYKYLLIPTTLFVFGRLSLYNFFGIYSYFNEYPLKTIFWCLMTGIVSSIVVVWLINQASQTNKLKKPVRFGLIIYATNLILFNSFMLLVFDFSVIDMSLRTIIDIVSISSGILILRVIKRKLI